MTARKAPKVKYVIDGPDIDIEKEVVLDNKGNRITQEYVDRAVADVHAKLRGRPSLTGANAPSPQVTFRLTPSLRRKAESRAKREGKRVSDVAREALERYLA